MKKKVTGNFFAKIFFKKGLSDFVLDQFVYNASLPLSPYRRIAYIPDLEMG